MFSLGSKRPKSKRGINIYPFCEECGARVDPIEGFLHRIPSNPKIDPWFGEYPDNTHIYSTQLSELLGVQKQTPTRWRNIGFGPPAIERNEDEFLAEAQGCSTTRWPMNTRRFIYPVKELREWIIDTTLPPQYAYCNFREIRLRLMEHEVRSVERVMKQVHFKTSKE